MAIRPLGAKVSAYFLVDVDRHDTQKRAKYVETFGDVLQKYGGRLLAGDHAPRTLEGSWKPHTVVIAEFSDMDALDKWYAPPELAPLRALREEGAVTNVVTVQGVRARSG
ncbi:MAG: DUF1330 domain-containing protein [Thermoplasmata archaeon]